MNTPQYRPAVRGLVVDTEQRILLVRLVFPSGAWWVLPGGGIEPHEDEHDALHRELAEEIGLVTCDIGPMVWRRTHTFSLQDTTGVRWDGQSESVYLVKTPVFDPQPGLSASELQAENIDDMRWWTRSEIAAHRGSDHFAPRDLAQVLSDLFDSEHPEIPFIIHQTD